MAYNLKPQTAFAYDLKSVSLVELVKQSNHLIVIETYPGIRIDVIVKALRESNYAGTITLTNELTKYDQAAFREAIFADLTNDRIFGRLTNKNYADFFDEALIKKWQKALTGHHVIIGIGASLFALPDSTIIYADLPRWTIQKRYRQGEGVFWASGLEADHLQNFKRGYFIEWRMADRIKKALWPRIDYFLQSDEASELTLLEGATIRRAVNDLALRPFRMEPYFDAGVWGGTWMQKTFNLPPLAKCKNYAWGFDGVPEENSINLRFSNNVTYAMPALNAILFAPLALLGKRTYERFGAEFPIRFDLLDTHQGQNLSLQVHPDDAYMQKHFNMPYGQSESYYILAKDPALNSGVYLGLKPDVTREALNEALQKAQQSNALDVKQYVNFFDVKKHDHISHPSGCIHASAANCVVLEVSSTPYIFTFKLWDWARLDFDHKPRPINIERGMANVDFSFNTEHCEAHCLKPAEVLMHDTKVKVEKTGLHERQFIETRRYSIAPHSSYELNTFDSVNMLNLVSGTRVTIEALNQAPLTINYAETFVVPASCKRYKARNNSNEPIMLLQAYVRS